MHGQEMEDEIIFLQLITNVAFSKFLVFILSVRTFILQAVAFAI